MIPYRTLIGLISDQQSKSVTISVMLHSDAQKNLSGNICSEPQNSVSPDKKPELLAHFQPVSIPALSLPDSNITGNSRPQTQRNNLTLADIDNLKNVPNQTLLATTNNKEKHDQYSHRSSTSTTEKSQTKKEVNVRQTKEKQ